MHYIKLFLDRGTQYAAKFTPYNLPFLLLRGYILTSYPARVKDFFTRGSLRPREYLTVKRQVWLCTFVGKAQPSLRNRVIHIEIGTARLHEDKASFVFESKASCRRSRFNKYASSLFLLTFFRKRPSMCSLRESFD